jgi:hypothetical protein
MTFRTAVVDWAGRAVRQIAGTQVIDSNIRSLSLSRADIEDRAELFYQFGGSEKLKFPQPVGLGSVPESIARITTREIQLPEPFVAEIHDVELVGPRGVCITNDNRYLLETSALGDPGVLAQNLLLTVSDQSVPMRWRRLKPIYKMDTAISLVGSWTHGYFHWTSDWLSRLEVLSLYEEKTGKAPPVLIPQDATRWMLDALEMNGINRDRWVEFDGSRLRVNTLIVPSIPRKTTFEDPKKVDVYSPRAYRWIRGQIRDTTNFSDVDNEPAENILISRNDAKNRRLVNEREILAGLSADFKSYSLSELSFREQVLLFANADTIVAPHGAGLTNILYSTDAVVIELFGSLTSPCYFTLSQIGNNRYGFVRCEQIERDIRVDPSKLTQLLHKVS